MKWLLDLLYPARCVSCKQSESWWCAQCQSSVERLAEHPCSRCLSVEQTHNCNGSLPFTGVIATGFYHSPPLRRLIADLKYQGVTASAPDIENYLRATHSSLPWRDEKSLLIVPLPLADNRERARGFNQAAFIAERMKSAWVIPGTLRTDLLLRRKTTAAQAELDHDATLRAANIRGAFQSLQPITTSILLVDDVVTTGSTAAEAAHALLNAGAPRVYLAALAVGK